MNKIGYCGCQFSSDARWGGMLISGRVLRLSVTFNTWSLCVNYQNTLIKINNPKKKNLLQVCHWCIGSEACSSSSQLPARRGWLLSESFSSLLVFFCLCYFVVFCPSFPFAVLQLPDVQIMHVIANNLCQQIVWLFLSAVSYEVPLK